MGPPCPPVPEPARPTQALGCSCLLSCTHHVSCWMLLKGYNRVFRGNLREIKSSSLAAQKTALSATTGRHPATGPTFPRSLLPSCSPSSLPIGIRSVCGNARSAADQMKALSSLDSASPHGFIQGPEKGLRVPLWPGFHMSVPAIRQQGRHCSHGPRLHTRARCGGARGSSPGAPFLESHAWGTVPDSGALSAKFQEQAAGLLISTKKDETSQTDGCHSREDTCK